jgi:hypothetical protein
MNTFTFSDDASNPWPVFFRRNSMESKSTISSIDEEEIMIGVDNQKGVSADRFYHN